MQELENRPTRVAVIGLGLMGRRMLGSFAAHPAFDGVCGLDRDPAVAQACATEFGFELSRSLEELLARRDLDLIYVATPPASHVPLARAVLESGRALWLEKPLAVDLESALELVELAESRAAIAALNFPLASLPGLELFERELADGSAGKPLRVEVNLHFSQWPRTWHVAGDWLAGDAEGGFLREVFSHFAYLTQRLLGPQRLLQASVSAEPGRCETRVVADLMAGDVPVSLVGGVGGAAPDFNRWTLFCERRSLRVEDWRHVSTSDGGAWQALPSEATRARDLEAQLNKLARLLKGEASRLPGLRDGLNVMRVVEGLVEAKRCRLH